MAQVGTRLAAAPPQERSPGGAPAAGRGMLLERWSMHYQPDPQDGSLQRSRSQLARLDPPAIYKRMVRAQVPAGANSQFPLPAQPWKECTAGMRWAQGEVGGHPSLLPVTPGRGCRYLGTWQGQARPHIWLSAALLL